MSQVLDLTLNTERKCGSCEEPNDNRMIACYTCEEVFHSSCAGIKPEEWSDGQAEWICDHCELDRTNLVATKEDVEQMAKRIDGYQKLMQIAVEDREKMEALLRQHADEATKRDAEMELLRKELTELKTGRTYNPKSGATPKIRRMFAERMSDWDKTESMFLNKFRMSDEDASSAHHEERASRTTETEGDRQKGGPEVGEPISLIPDRMEQLIAFQSRQFGEQLPDFDGADITKWGEFKQAFERSTTHGMYSEYENMNRLRAHLLGQAKGLVRDQLEQSNSATSIMSYLEERYGRPDILCRQYVQPWLAHEALKNNTDEKLISLAITGKTAVGNLKTLKNQLLLKQEYILTMLHDKLESTSYYQRWARKKLATPELDLEDFANFLMEQMKELPINVLAKQAGSSANKPKAKPVLVHGALASPERKRRGCHFCCQDHGLWNCSSFMALDVISRWDFVRDKTLCFACLGTDKHRSPDCPRKRVCNIDGCQKDHNRLLHTVKPAPEGGDGEQHQLKQDAPVFVPHEPVRHQNHHENNEAVFYKIVPVRIYDAGGRPVNTFALLDGASGATLIEDEMFKRLRLGGSKEMLSLQWTKSIVRREETIRADMKISAANNRRQFTLNNVFTVKDLNLPSQTRDAKMLFSQFKHLRGLPIQDLNSCQPTILIGLEHAKLLVESNVHQGGDADPIASKTPLGWIVWGRSTPSVGILTHQQMCHARVNYHMPARSDDQELHEMVKEYFSTENFGVTPGKVALVGRKEKRAIDLMSGLMKFDGERYEMPLLWEADDVVLPDSRPMAYKRLCMLEKKLLKNAEMKVWMDNYVQELLEKGYAREATVDDLNTPWARIWYAPLFVVVNENKIPPKPRVVADVAAQVRGVSLNSKLLKGPDNAAPLLAGLCKFREKEVAVNSDVKEMFPQIRIRMEDQQCQRFLYRNCDQNSEPTIYIMQRMMFGPTCSPTTAQFVKNQHANQFRDRYPEAVRALTETTYVDDYFNSHDSVDEALKVLSEAIQICKSMGFELVGAQSNNRELIAKIPSSNVKQALVDLHPADETEYVTKVLGMFWMPTNDEFTFKSGESDTKPADAKENKVVTKREVLRTVMKMWDPLGLLSHFRIQGKIILQEIWKSGADWDEIIQNDLQSKWESYAARLKDVEMVKIPRHYSPGFSSSSSVTLIVFTDASTEAYSASAYFRFEEVRGAVHVAQVMAKAKVAPIKPLTMPNMELQGAVLGKRLKETICEMHQGMKISKFFLLSDSECVLHWIWSDHFKFTPFVAARVSEVLDGTSADDWYHVGTADNVADDATRFKDVDVGNVGSRWYQGPDFLRQPFENWPISQEKRKAVLFHQAEPKESERPLYENIKPHFKSNWTSLVNVTAFLLRGIQKLCKRPTNFTNYISVDEFARAELILFRNVQKEAFPDEMQALQISPDGATVSASSKIVKFCPFLDEHGVIRMSTRSQLAKISYAAQSPSILPNKHDLVDLLISRQHQINKHLGEDRTIADLRERVWIIGIRTAVRRVVNRCQLCKIKNATPRFPLMGQLPIERIDFGVKAFSYVGLDCFGPLTIRHGRGTAKRYGLIMTCLTYRAVHLELLSDMSLDQVMIAIQNLLARRGRVRALRSDQGKNFIGAANQLKRDGKELEEAYGRAVAERFRVEWTFLPAYSPWMGGAWERLIQSIKKSVYFTLNGEVPREDVLRGALVQAEYEMNRRPLTHTPISHEDAPPLTPNIAMFGADEDNQPTLEVCAISPLAYRRVEHLSQKYMQRWVTEYLPEITRRSKWYRNVKQIAVGDVVIIVEPNEMRQDWKRGRVVAVHPGPDGIVRSADVMLSDKSIKRKRAAGRLAVLDVFGSSTEFSDGPGNVIQHIHDQNEK